MLEYALSTDPLRRIVRSGAWRACGAGPASRGSSKWLGAASPDDCLWVVPPAWRDRLARLSRAGRRGGVVSDVTLKHLRLSHRQPWLVVSNGRFAAHVSGPLLQQVLDDCHADALAVTATADLLAYHERVRLTEREELVGYRRFYRDSMEPTPIPHGWPHHLFIRRECAQTILGKGVPDGFEELLQRLREHQLRVRAVAVAGSVVDLDTPEGLLTLSEIMLKQTDVPGLSRRLDRGHSVFTTGRDNRVSHEAQFIGSVLIGRDVCVEPGTVIVGPCILSDGCTVRRDAVVDASILGTEAVVEANATIENVVDGIPGRPPETFASLADRDGLEDSISLCSRASSVFRDWPRFSYAGCFKRVIDAVAAAMVLILFMPIIPLIALAVKMSSPGPVFFKHRRQGLHGRFFNCIKFRTMRVGADDIQDKLRFVCEVDGPQFKMADDPRISTVGWFLRETYLDEIPQFFNVLCGDMSVVGPRPSPESENTLCPSWRDARLSVRPGITGLWQINRTRRPFKDFQEWIQFDTQYVRQLSPRMDLWICWRTFRKMLESFIHQF